MGDLIRRFFRENEHLKPLTSATEEEQAVLLRANEKRYITLQESPDKQKCFTQEDLVQARMWKEKGCLD